MSMSFSLSAHSIRGVLLDIEGTTTPIAFVYSVLFPFARERVKEYLDERFYSEDTQADLAHLREENRMDLAQNSSPPELVDNARGAMIDSFVAYTHWLMDRDRKTTGLKSLQGKIWKQGYENGSLEAEVYADVPPALARWRRARLKVSIFSSGSVLAQQLLFAHTESGDLTGFIDSYFDTTTGPKSETASYRSIASALDLATPEMVFVSDVTKELDPAREAGMQTLLCVRPGNHPQPTTENYPIIKSFDEIVD